MYQILFEKDISFCLTYMQDKIWMNHYIISFQNGLNSTHFVSLQNTFSQLKGQISSAWNLIEITK